MKSTAVGLLIGALLGLALICAPARANPDDRLIGALNTIARAIDGLDRQQRVQCECRCGR